MKKYLRAAWAAISYPVIALRQKLIKWLNDYADKREVAVMQGGISVTQGMAKAWKCYLCDDRLDFEMALQKLWSSYKKPVGISSMSPESVAEGLTRATAIAFGARVTDDGRWFMKADNPIFGFMARKAGEINPAKIEQDAIQRGKDLHTDLFKFRGPIKKVTPVEGVSIGGDTF